MSTAVILLAVAGSVLTRATIGFLLDPVNNGGGRAVSDFDTHRFTHCALRLRSLVCESFLKASIHAVFP